MNPDYMFALLQVQGKLRYAEERRAIATARASRPPRAARSGRGARLPLKRRTVKAGEGA